VPGYAGGCAFGFCSLAEAEGRKPGRRGDWWNPAVPAFASLVPGYAGGCAFGFCSLAEAARP
jgi:hypothetical protein